jgi:hypothetical protein
MSRWVFVHKFGASLISVFCRVMVLSRKGCLTSTIMGRLDVFIMSQNGL